MLLVTHDGPFHLDELVAYTSLAMAVGDEHELIRTKDKKIIERADIAFDVGEGKYDHHQRGGNGIRLSGTRYAAAGLIWRDYGTEVVRRFVERMGINARLVDGSLGTQTVADRVDAMFIERVDAHDNGQAVYDLGTRFGYANPQWNDPSTHTDVNAAFMRASAIIRGIIEQAIIDAIDGKEELRITWDVETYLKKVTAHAQESMKAAHHVFEIAVKSVADARIIVLPMYAPEWQRVVCASPDATYVIYPVNGTWQLWCVPHDADHPTTQRRPLPEVWSGLRDSEFAKESGVPDAIFCHAQRFCAAAHTQLGAYILAMNALSVR